MKYTDLQIQAAIDFAQSCITKLRLFPALDAVKEVAQ